MSSAPARVNEHVAQLRAGAPASGTIDVEKLAQVTALRPGEVGVERPVRRQFLLEGDVRGRDPWITEVGGGHAHVGEQRELARWERGSSTRPQVGIGATPGTRPVKTPRPAP